MNVELEQQLCAAFPRFFAALAQRKTYTLDEMMGADIRSLPSITVFGIETENGWYDLLRQLAENLEPWCKQTGDYCVQLKEKFGTLRCYMRGGSQSVPGGTSEPEVEKIIAVAMRASANVCEVCGAPGAVRNHGGWYETRCDACDAPSVRFIAQVESVERLIRYVIMPKTEDEARKWRLALRDWH